ncbi:alpha/beta hydrolase [Chitinophaga hostae]|uniref:alpha/beta hydrolase n=1 Tax=Chitinophaga hostae TaxID=2831022 RepID=UPI003F6A30C0
MEKQDLAIILVHGAWGDGSHWRHIIPILDKAGYAVRAVQNPLTSPEDDINKTIDLIDAQEGKVLLVGHSYGGTVITGAGNHDKVVGLVYIAAFAPDEGDSVISIFDRRERTSGAASIYPDAKAFLWIKYSQFHAAFCHDLSEDDGLVMSLTQKPSHAKCFQEKTQTPAWKTRPSWYQVSDQDHVIPPVTEKEMAEAIRARKIIHLDASHTSMSSHPQEVAALILEAAEECVTAQI